jgi:hypothetical protein
VFTHFGKRGYTFAGIDEGEDFPVLPFPNASTQIATLKDIAEKSEPEALAEFFRHAKIG